MNNRLHCIALFLLCTCRIAVAQVNISDSLYHQNLVRKYVVHVPPTYNGTANVPIVIFLHGGNGNSLSAQGFTSFNQVSNASGFIVVYPQGYYATSPNSYVWADGRNTGADLAGIDDVGFLDKIIESLPTKYKISDKRIYLCGFSNGSFMTQRMAFESKSHFAAMGTLGGTLDSNLYVRGNPRTSIPMMYVFGTLDPYVPYNGGLVAGTATVPVVGIDRAVDFWVKKNKCRTQRDSVSVPDIDKTDSSNVVVYEYTDCDCNANVKFYKIVGGGHTWPGIEIANTEISLGRTNKDINAAVELWKFFSQYTVCTTSVVREEEKYITSYELYHNYPNPFNPSTVITYRLATSGHVRLNVRDILGRELTTLVDEIQQPGAHQVQFNALTYGMSSGMYLYTLHAGGTVETKRMMLLK